MAEADKPILEVQDLSKYFGGIKAVDELTFNVRQGEILGLLGPNGSGKTTLFNLITGVYEADSGKVRFQDQDITNQLSYKIALKGISRTFQSTKVFHTQTVLDNIATAMIARARKRHVSETRKKVVDDDSAFFSSNSTFSAMCGSLFGSAVADLIAFICAISLAISMMASSKSDSSIVKFSAAIIITRYETDGNY